MAEMSVGKQRGEGLPSVLIGTIEKAALMRDFVAIEWPVLVRNCPEPISKLTRVLEDNGFGVREFEGGAACYWQRRSTNELLIRRGVRQVGFVPHSHHEYPENAEQVKRSGLTGRTAA